MEIGKRIIDAAIENGATLAGIAGMKALKVSASHTVYMNMGDYSGIGAVKDEGVIQSSQLFRRPYFVFSLHCQGGACLLDRLEERVRLHL